MGSDKPLVIENNSLRVQADTVGGAWYLLFQHRAGDAWRTVLSTALSKWGGNVPADREDGFVLDPIMETHPYDDDLRNHGFLSEGELSADGSEIVLRGTLSFWGAGKPMFIVTQRVTLTEQTVRVKVTHTTTGCSEQGLSKLMSCLFFAPDGVGRNVAEPLEFAWIPALHRAQDDVVGDHVFRSPATIVQGNGLYAALVPDLDLLQESRPTIRHAMDLRRAGWHNYGEEPFPAGQSPRLYYGFCTWRPYLHVYYKHSPSDQVLLAPGDLSYGFDLFLGESNGPEEVCRRVNDYLWRRYGSPNLTKGLPQVLPLEEYGRKYAYAHELPRLLAKTTINGKSCAGINNQDRHGANYHAWENDLVMGFGMRHYGDRWGDANLRGVADGIRNMILSSPGAGGAFKCIYNFAEKQFEGSLHWTTRPADYLNGYDTAAMGVTAWWMCYWHERFGGDEDFVARVTDYANFLADNQLPSGAVPTYLDADLKPFKHLLESGTSAISGAVLAKAAMLTGDERLREAALAAGRYVDVHVVSTQKFYDFETFYSCSPKPLTWIDPVSGQPPQNNLAVQWAADQFLALYKLTGDEYWLTRGVFVLDLLSFYHQVWSPSYYVGNIFGGFGVMNTDGEWNDGRQARFVHTYADYYDATGKTEYLQRAVAAARASFALMDMEENHANGINVTTVGQGPDGWPGKAPENIYHCGPTDTVGGYSGFNWEAGGGMTSAADLHRRFGDVWVDAESKLTVGIDGVSARVLAWEGETVDLQIESTLAELRSPYTKPRELVVKFGRLADGTYLVRANGRELGRLDANELRNGATFTL